MNDQLLIVVAKFAAVVALVDAFVEILKPFYVNLDFEITNQNTDGSWSPNWNWANTYETEWHIAKREWSGVLTLERLKLFKEFGKI